MYAEPTRAKDDTTKRAPWTGREVRPGRSYSRWSAAFPVPTPSPTATPEPPTSTPPVSQPTGTPLPPTPTAAAPTSSPSAPATSTTAPQSTATTIMPSPTTATQATATAPATPAVQSSPSPGAAALRLATNHATVELPWFRKVIESFGRDNPGLRVEQTNTTARYLEQIAGWAGEGKLPDVLYVRSPHASACAFKRWIGSIDDLVNRDGRSLDLADFHALQTEELKSNGKWLLLPHDYTVQTVFSRTDAFSEAGGPLGEDPSWTELIDAARRATKRDATGVARWGFSWHPDAGTMPGLWLSETGRFFRDDGRGIAIASAEHVRITQWLADLALVEGVAPKPSDFQSGALAAGKVAAEVAGSWSAAAYRSAGGKVTCSCLPRGASGRRAGYACGSGWAISQPTKLREEAWKLLQHLTTRDSLEILVALPVRNVPGRVSAMPLWQASLEALGSPERPAAIKRMTTESFAHQQAVWWLDYQDLYGELMPKVWSGEKKASEVLPTLEKQVNAAAARYTV
jgi:ABC-type glycerol-3-phosphate transport system substrate-binding protein